jgi:transcriptional regulator with XRE-family HTH domain
MPITKIVLKPGEAEMKWSDCPSPGRAVRLLRRQAGLFIMGLAERIECSPQTLYEIEIEKRRIRPAVAVKLGAVFGVDLLEAFPGYFAKKVERRPDNLTGQVPWFKACSPGQAVARLRRDHGQLRKMDLGEMLGVSRCDVTNLELGKRALDVATAEKIGRLFGVDFVGAFPLYFGPGGPGARAVPFIKEEEPDIHWSEAGGMGPAVRILRRQRGLTLNDLAEIVGCRSCTLSEIELGKRKIRGGYINVLDHYFDIDLRTAFPVELAPHLTEDAVPGQAIYRLRKQLGMSRNEFCRIIGRPLGSFIKWEKCQSDVPYQVAEIIDQQFGAGLLVRYSCFLKEFKPDAPESEEDSTPGQAVKRLRSYHGLSLQIFGEKVGVSRQIVRQWEAGRCRPSRPVFEKLDELFGGSLTSRFGSELRKYSRRVKVPGESFDSGR